MEIEGWLSGPKCFYLLQISVITEQFFPTTTALFRGRLRVCLGLGVNNVRCHLREKMTRANNPRSNGKVKKTVTLPIFHINSWPKSREDLSFGT